MAAAVAEGRKNMKEKESKELKFRMDFAADRLDRKEMTKECRRIWQEEYNNCKSRLERMRKKTA